MHFDILSGKGGTGKTTTALHLAGKFASEGANVQVVDLDPQRSACDWFAHAQRVLGFTLFSVVPGAPVGHPDVVIYDHAPEMHPRPRSKTLILAIQPSLLDYNAARRAHKMLGASYPIYDVLTRVNASRSEDREIVAEMKISAIISDRSIYKRILSAGTHLRDPIVANYYGVRDAAREIDNIYNGFCDFYAKSLRVR